MKTTRAYKCVGCGRQEQRETPPKGYGSADDSARTAGWRIGATGRAARQEICPECADVDDNYWDRRTLTTAYAAGIDAGNTAWGGA